MPSEHNKTRLLQRHTATARPQLGPWLAEENEHGEDAFLFCSPSLPQDFCCVSSLSPVFFGVSPLSKQRLPSNKMSVRPRALVGWEEYVVLACVRIVQAKPRTAHVTQDTGDNERSRHFLGVGLESRGVGGFRSSPQ